jgi:hypothetical protein
MFAAAAVMLGVVGNIAASAVRLPYGWIPWTWAATTVLGLMIVIGTVREYRKTNLLTDGGLRDLDLMNVADQLAISIRRQWEDEAAWRQLNDPYPMPVRWRPADADLFASWQTLVRLASSGPGWPPVATGAWADNPAALVGADNDLVDVLARVPTGRLVVLGEPGAGKTILLVRLTLDLLSRRGPGQAVPVLLPLASWNPTDQDLYSWIEHRLVTDNAALATRTLAGSAESQARGLVRAGLILPVLDGLDEIPDAVRGSAITRINDAMRPGQRLVLSARTIAYRTAVRPPDGVEVQMTGTAGIELCPLDPGTVADYLRDSAGGSTAAGRWDEVLSTFTVDPPSPVAQALATPLMAALARVIYNPRPGENLASVRRHPSELLNLGSFPNREVIRRHLFDCFIPAAYRSHPDRSRQCRWSALQAERWLAFLARDLDQRPYATTDIAWWELPGAAPGALSGLTIGLVAALVGGLGLPVQWGIGFGAALIIGPLAALSIRLVFYPRRSASKGGLLQGLIGGLLGGLFGSLASHAVFEETVDLRVYGPIVLGGIGIGIAVAVMRSFVAGLVGGLAGGFAGSLLGFFADPHSPTYAISFTNALGLGISAGLAAGVANRRIPTQGLHWSPIGLVCGLAIGSAAGFVIWAQAGPTGGLSVGIAAAIAGGCAGGLLFNSTETDLTRAATPRTVLDRDRGAFLTSFLGLGLAMGLGNGLQVGFGISLPNGRPNGLWVGIEVGLLNLIVVGLAFGFLQAAWGSFTLARWWLAASRRLPWRLMTFLADAHTNRGVLRQVGAIYQFRHVDLQRRLAGDR